MLNANSSHKRKLQPALSLLIIFTLFFVAGVTTWILSDPRFALMPQIKLSLRKFQKFIEPAKENNQISSQTAQQLVANGDANNRQIDVDQLANSDTVDLQQACQFIIALKKQVASSPTDPSLHNRLGISYAQIGDLRAAAKEFNESIGLCRSSGADKSVDKSFLYVQLSCAHSNLARIYDKLGDHAAVVKELKELNNDIAFAGEKRLQSKKQVITGSSSSTVSNAHNLTPAEAQLLARGEALREVGRLDEAGQVFNELISTNPKLAIAHQRLGLVGVAENNLWLAINELEIACQLDKTDPDTANDLGLIYNQIGDYKAAQASFWRSHKIAPKNLSASINLSNSLANSGNYKAGIGIMQQAITFHPTSASAYNNLGALIAHTNNQTEAAKSFAKAIHLNPRLPSAHYGLGLALLKLKSYPSAISEFQAAMSLSPGILDLQNKIDLANRSNLRSLAYTQTSFN